MHFYGKAAESADRILELFKLGNVPAALAPIFIRRDDDAPCRRWFRRNQLLTALSGYHDARLPAMAGSRPACPQGRTGVPYSRTALQDGRRDRRRRDRVETLVRVRIQGRGRVRPWTDGRGCAARFGR